MSPNRILPKHSFHHTRHISNIAIKSAQLPSPRIRSFCGFSSFWQHLGQFQKESDVVKSRFPEYSGAFSWSFCIASSEEASHLFAFIYLLLPTHQRSARLPNSEVTWSARGRHSQHRPRGHCCLDASAKLSSFSKLLLFITSNIMIRNTPAPESHECLAYEPNFTG